MTILGLDVGDKKIGLAVGDDATQLAFPRPALLVDDWGQVWPAIEKILADEAVDRIIVGWPLNSDGTIGPQAERVAEFIDQLEQRVSPPVIKRDERLTTAAVQREQQGRSLPRGAEDSLAAQLLLESYLTEKHD